MDWTEYVDDGTTDASGENNFPSMSDSGLVDRMRDQQSRMHVNHALARALGMKRHQRMSSNECLEF